MKLSNIKSTICRWKKKDQSVVILFHLNKKVVLDNQKETLETKKVNYFVKLTDFSKKWWVFNNGFKGQNRLRAISKALHKITIFSACFSMSFFNFKITMLDATFFEKQHVLRFDENHPGYHAPAATFTYVNWYSRSPLKKKIMSVHNRNLAIKYSRWCQYLYY